MRMPSPSRPILGPKLRQERAFTLVEMLVVIAIFSVLLSLSVLSVRGSLDNYRISSTAAQVQSDLAYASQFASKSNASVYFRFYRYETARDEANTTLFRAYQLLQLDYTTGELVPLGNVKYFEQGIVIYPDAQYSNILERDISPAGESDPTIPIGIRSDEIKSRAYEYCELRLNPDGSTSLEKDRSWCLTLVFDHQAEELSPPGSARVLVINSITGAVRIY